MQLNTYQSLIVTDFNRTFAILLYADIQWVSTQSNLTRYAQVGVYSGDRMHFKEFPYSGTANLTNLEQFTNVDVPGMSLYEISDRTVRPAGCTITSEFVAVFVCLWWELGGISYNDKV